MTIEAIRALGDHFSVPDTPVTADFADLCTRIGQSELYWWFARKSKEDQSDTVGTGNAQLHRDLTVHQIRHKVNLQKLFNLLEENDLPFVPIKGVDLAFRIYPFPALRLFGDWDIWVQKKDLNHFCTLLKAHGWQCSLDSWSDHHCGLYTNGAFCIEPHFSLPNFINVPPSELWAETVAVSGKNSERHLSDELNLIMLFRHSLGDRFRGNPVKLLLDTEFLLQKYTIHWDKVSLLCRKWKIAHPGLLLEALPEFFKKRYDSGCFFEKPQILALRQLIMNTSADNEKMNTCCRIGTSSLLSHRWLAIQLIHLRKDNLRWNYPRIGNSNVKYLYFLICDIIRKIFFYFRLKTSQSGEIKAQIAKEQLVESSWTKQSCGSVAPIGVPLSNNEE